MTTDPVGAPPRRSKTAITVPLLVAAWILGLLGWSAWPVLRPAPLVRVGQAVFERVSAQPAESTEQAVRRPTVQAAGWLEAEPFYVACAALADGVVESIEVLEGEPVEAGQVVARLVDDDSRIRLRLAEAALSTARAELASAEAEAQAAQQSWDNPVELDRAVDAGTAALAEAQAELDQLPALIDAARATLVGLEEEHRRAKESAERGVTNELEVILAEQAAANQRANVKALEAKAPILSARADRLRADLEAAQLDLELRIEDKRRLAATQAALERANAAVLEREAARDEAALELERMVIRSPVGGYAQRRLKAPGDKVVRMMDDPHSAHILHVYDPSMLQVRVDVPLADASHVYAGQACEVVVEVLPERVFKGEVLRTTHEADLQKNTLEVKVKIFDPDPVLRPEMLTRVKFLGTDLAPNTPEGGPVSNRVRAPAEAVDERPGRPVVWVVAERHKRRGVLRERPVTVVESGAGYVTVEGDLEPGALLALGPDAPADGQRVRIGGNP